MRKILKENSKYFKTHPVYNAVVHIIGGVGIGILLVYPVVGIHPLRWGASLIVLAILGYLYPLIIENKKI